MNVRNLVAAVVLVLGAVSACSDSAEQPRFSKLPDKCFAGLDTTLQDLAGPLYGLHRNDGPSLPATDNTVTCNVSFQDSANTLKQPGKPYQRDLTVMYSVYLDYQGVDAVSRAKDSFRSSVFRPATVSPSSSLGIGDEAASWAGNPSLPGWKVEFRESNLVALVTVAGSDYAPDATIQEWPNIPGQLREPAERAARGIAQRGV